MAGIPHSWHQCAGQRRFARRSGCIRMNAPDIKALFSSVRTGTPVKVINEPVKYSVEPNGMRYVEVHRPLSAEEELAERSDNAVHAAKAGFTQFKRQ